MRNALPIVSKKEITLSNAAIMLEENGHTLELSDAALERATKLVEKSIKYA